MNQILQFPTIRSFWTNDFDQTIVWLLAHKRHPVFQEIIYTSFSATLYFRGIVPYWLIDVHYRAVGHIMTVDYCPDGSITEFFDPYGIGDFLPHHWIEIKPSPRSQLGACLRYTVDNQEL